MKGKWSGLVKRLPTTRGICLATTILLVALLLISLYRAYPLIDNVNAATSTGDDWLLYKQYALNILHDGILMPAVAGTYYEPAGFIYNYFIASVFALFGESFAHSSIVLFLGPLIIIGHVTSYGLRMIVPVIPLVLLLAVHSSDATRNSFQLSLRNVIGAARGNADELVCLDDVSGQAMAVHAARVEALGATREARTGRGPVSEEHYLFAVINFVPRDTFTTRAVFSERAQFRQILRRLCIERDTWAHACMHDEVRAQINH
jgi:hypothetical protein